VHVRGPPQRPPACEGGHAFQILIAIAAVVVIGLITMAARQRRTTALRQRSGPEYDRAVEARQDQRAADLVSVDHDELLLADGRLS
jgi:hypothetical protein